ncbi:FERM domain-containing protein 8 [Platichthys flesus]|uniref:FERM domain-containing protein 8 n=1 Tax=Platichthys flesus TaxID=8260 RepID=UPI002DB7E925|nr:FERM domain-containing protein 8 [Platichthys flesus]XP_062262093.1 FERM domain-containing protein 8 [Platichthys flesus]XP_062262094.1 FERM domain-containing protein 8 [Platichthys flesus]
MEGDDCSFPPDSSDDHSQRGSVASSATLSRAQDVLVYLFGDSAVHLTVEGLGSVTVTELGRSVHEALNVPEAAHDAFAFWLCSPLLELQLKMRHQPYKLCRQWQDLLYRFTEASREDISQDEPYLQYRRNVFYPKSKELQIDDEGVLKLLYEEARNNILSGRYPCDPEHWMSLGALSLAIEEGTGLDGQQFTATVREKKLTSYVPAHVTLGSGGLLSTLRGKSSRLAGLEQKLLEEYRKIHTSAAIPPEPTQLLHQYLNTCHTLPYYGCGFFFGEIDKPGQGILQRGKRKAVNVGICLEGVYVMDVKEKHVLLGLRFVELSWDHSYPEEEGDSHILWLEFDGEEDGTPVNKLLKIYSKQAELMSGFIEFCLELKSASEGAAAVDMDGEVGLSQQPAGQDGSNKNGRGGRRGVLHRQSSVVCSRVHSLNTISYVDNGKEIKRLKPKRAASFFTRQSSYSTATYSAVQVTESLEQG